MPVCHFVAVEWGICSQRTTNKLTMQAHPWAFVSRLHPQSFDVRDLGSEYLFRLIDGCIDHIGFLSIFPGKD